MSSKRSKLKKKTKSRAAPSVRMRKLLKQQREAQFLANNPTPTIRSNPRRNKYKQQRSQSNSPINVKNNNFKTSSIGIDAAKDVNTNNKSLSNSINEINDNTSISFNGNNKNHNEKQESSSNEDEDVLMRSRSHSPNYRNINISSAYNKKELIVPKQSNENRNTTQALIDKVIGNIPKIKRKTQKRTFSDVTTINPNRTTDITSLLTPSTVTETQKSLVIEQASQSTVTKLHSKQQALLKTAEHARKCKNNKSRNEESVEPPMKKRKLKDNSNGKIEDETNVNIIQTKNDEPPSKTGKLKWNIEDSNKQFDEAAKILEENIKLKYYSPNEEKCNDKKLSYYLPSGDKFNEIKIKSWNDIFSSDTYQQLLSELNKNGIKQRKICLIQASNISCLFSLVQITNKSECTVSSKLLGIALNLLPISIYAQKNAEISGKALGASLRKFLNCNKSKIKYKTMKKNDLLHHLMVKDNFAVIIQHVLNLKSMDDAKKLIATFDITKTHNKKTLNDNYDESLLSTQILNNLTNDYIPSKSIYNSKLSEFMKYKIASDHKQFVENENVKILDVSKHSSKKNKSKQVNKTKNVETKSNDNLTINFNKNTNMNDNTNTNANNQNKNEDERKKEENEDKSVIVNDITYGDINSCARLLKRIGEDSALLDKLLKDEQCYLMHDILEQLFVKDEKQIISERGLMRGTKYIHAGVAGAVVITGQNMQSSELSVNKDRGTCLVKCSIVNLCAAPDWEGFELFQATTPIRQCFDTIPFEIERNVTKDECKVIIVSDTKICVLYPLNNHKLASTFSFNTKINNLQFQKCDLFKKKRRKMLAIEAVSNNLEMLQTHLLHNEELLSSLKLQFRSIKRLEKLSSLFEEKLLPIAASHDACKRHINYDGDLDTNTIFARNRPKLVWNDDCKLLHKTFLLIKFGESLDLCTPWTVPNNDNDTVVFNYNDCYPYQLNIYESMKAGDVFIP